MGIITVATDFGRVDGYTAAMKGVIKSIAPKSEIIDITDELTGVAKAAFALYRYYSAFPQGTVHLVVVDPGVGSSRKALAGLVHDRFFVGPDNGVFTRVIQSNLALKSIWCEIDVSKLSFRKISPTFHGRDIFAPTAALLSGGKSLDGLGTKISNPVLINIPEPVAEPDFLRGEVIDIDKFGNLITNIPACFVLGNPKASLGEYDSIPFKKTFSDIEEGFPVAYIGSLNYLEIAVNKGRADSFFGASIGSKVGVFF
jgi:S-adenosylmethionine hydrolase